MSCRRNSSGSDTMLDSHRKDFQKSCDFFIFLRKMARFLKMGFSLHYFAVFPCQRCGFSDKNSFFLIWCHVTFTVNYLRVILPSSNFKYGRYPMVQGLLEMLSLFWGLRDHGIRPEMGILKVCVILLKVRFV